MEQAHEHGYVVQRAVPSSDAKQPNQLFASHVFHCLLPLYSVKKLMQIRPPLLFTSEGVERDAPFGRLTAFSLSQTPTWLSRESLTSCLFTNDIPTLADALLNDVLLSVSIDGMLRIDHDVDDDVVQLCLGQRPRTVQLPPTEVSQLVRQQPCQQPALDFAVLLAIEVIE